MNLTHIFKNAFINTLILVTCANISIAQVTNTVIAKPISVDLFAEKIKQEANPQIIDARTPEEFLTNHINGAINVDMRKTNYLVELKNINKHKPVFIYAIQTNRPDVLAKQLKELGYDEVYELKSGIAAWIGGGYPYFNAALNTITLNDYNNIINENKLILVDIGTKYCGICKKVKQTIDSLKQEKNNAYKIMEIELYDNPQLAADIKIIHAVPTVLIYKKGKVIWQKTGADIEKKDIETIIINSK